MGSDSNQNEPREGLYWLVEVDGEKCSLCEVCVGRCPRDAIRSEAEASALTLQFSHKLCDGCRDCLEKCPEEAIALVEIQSSPEGPEWSILATSQMLRCSQCQTLFAPEAKLGAASHRRGEDRELIREQCPLCRRTQMVARFIDEKRKTDGPKGEYKTGTKWYWKPVVEGDRDAPPCMETFREKPRRDPPPGLPSDNPSLE